MNADSQSILLSHLKALYGANDAENLCQRIEALLQKYSFPNPATERKSTTGLTERDALLITYGDQVTEPGAAPLETLGNFLQQYGTGLVSGVHILPFYPYTSDDGFAVTDYLTVDPQLGTWEHLARLSQNFDLMVDGVFNHLSAQSLWFQQFVQGKPGFSDFFVTVEGQPDLAQVIRPRALPLLTSFQTAQGQKQVWTTFSADQVDLNFKNPEVLLAILDVLLFYVARGARFIRLDAIAFLWKEIGTTCLHLPQTHRVIQLFRAVLDQVAPQVLLITETNVPHEDNLSYFGNGVNEAQLIYNFALAPLVLHTLRVGQATPLTRWATSLRVPSSRATLLNFLASHDGIGLNPVRGILSPDQIQALVDRTQAHGGFISYKHNPDGTRSPYELNITYFDALSDPNAPESPQTQVDRFMVAQAIMLALAGVPAIYFHSLFGSRNDRLAAQTSGIPRRINRRKFSKQELEAKVKNLASLPSQVFTRYQALLRVRRAHAAFHPHGQQQVLSDNPRVFALLRISPEVTDQVLCVHNVSNSSHPVKIRLPESYAQTTWQNLFTAETHGVSTHYTFSMTLAPYQTAWLHLVSGV